MHDNAWPLICLEPVQASNAAREHACPRIGMHALNSACAGEFILIGLSVDTIHRGTTMFDRHPTRRPR
jgi:hypothetical protein